jgi:ABC-type uncharacterized transport system substrate-binding protein
MRRREFLGVLASVATAWPLPARGQQREPPMRRVGVLVGGASAESSESQASVAAFLQEMKELGWIEGSNLRIVSLWAVGNSDNASEFSSELATLARSLVALAPEVILTNGTGAVSAVLKATQTVPIVFVNVTDPIGAGFIDSLTRPGGTATGFMNFQHDLAFKWLELLKEVSPHVARVAVLQDAAAMAGSGQWDAIQVAARSTSVEVIPADLGKSTEIERAFAAFARASINSGLIVTSSANAIVHRKLIIALAARHKLPAVYSRRLFVVDGGLISYGINPIHQYRLAAGYVDRILKGEKPGSVPVMLPTRVELAVNLKTAKALGIEIPPAILSEANEVIE